MVILGGQGMSLSQRKEESIDPLELEFQTDLRHLKRVLKMQVLYKSSTLPECLTTSPAPVPNF